MSYDMDITLRGRVDVKLKNLDMSSLADAFMMFHSKEVMMLEGIYYAYTPNTKVHAPIKSLKSYVGIFLEKVIAPALMMELKKIEDSAAELESSTMDDALKQIAKDKIASVYKLVKKYISNCGVTFGGSYLTFLTHLTMYIENRYQTIDQPKRWTLANGFCFDGMLYDRSMNLQYDALTSGFLVTQGCQTSYNPTAKAPVFEARLAVSYPDAEMRKYFQYCMGRMINPNSKSVGLLYSGSNTGKSTLIHEIILPAVQPYFGPYGADIIRRNSTEMTPSAYSSLNKIVQHQQACIVVDELDNRHTLNVAKIKEITGGTQIESKAMGQDISSSKIQSSVLILTNHMPDFLTSDDAGFKNRLIKFPEPAQISFDFVLDVDGKQYTFDDLKDAVAEEKEGILAWLIEGYKMYRANPNWIPDAMRIAQDSLKQEIAMGDTAQWMLTTGFCITDEEVKRHTKGVAVSSITASYLYATGMRSVKTNRLSSMLESAGFVLKGGGEKARRAGWVVNLGFELDDETVVLIDDEIMSALSGLRRDEWHRQKITDTIRFALNNREMRDYGRTLKPVEVEPLWRAQEIQA